MVPKCALSKYLLAPTFLDKIFVKFVRKKGGVCSGLTSLLRGGVQILTNADMGGGGVKKLQKYADVICERPLMIFSKIIQNIVVKRIHLLSTPAVSIILLEAFKLSYVL